MGKAGQPKSHHRKGTQRQSQVVRELETILGIRLPSSYRRFLEDRGNAVVNGLPLLGLPISPDVDSAWGATELLRAARPDLLDQFVVVRLLDTRALCLDLRDECDNDAPLVEVDIDGTELPRNVHHSFDEYLTEADRSKRQLDDALSRIRWHLGHSSKAYEHTAEGQRLPFRPHHWRVMRSCVHDLVVGLASIKHNESFGGLEVDVFVCSDHPDYEPRHGARALILLLLSDAYRNCGSMEIRFTRYDFKTKRRVAERIPSAIVSLGKHFGIEFSEKAKGRIKHHEAVRLFVSVIGIDDQVADAIRGLEKRNLMTLEGACYFLGTRLWTREEASWILLNHPRPQGLLYGEDYPEDRFKYVESLCYGRAVIAATSLREKLSSPDGNFDGDCRASSLGAVWELSPVRKVELDWHVSGESVALEAGRSLAILPRPRFHLPDDGIRILEEAQQLAEHRTGQDYSFLLYSQEILKTPKLPKCAAKAREDYSVDILVMPATCRELDELVELRMSKGRMLVR